MNHQDKQFQIPLHASESVSLDVNDDTTEGNALLATGQKNTSKWLEFVSDASSSEADSKPDDPRESFYITDRQLLAKSRKRQHRQAEKKSKKVKTNCLAPCSTKSIEPVKQISVESNVRKWSCILAAGVCESHQAPMDMRSVSQLHNDL
jgi:hypothetical protein